MQKKINFSVNGMKLSGTFLTPDVQRTDKSAVLFIHGWLATETRNIVRADPLTKLGYTCLTFELRGHGASEGKNKDLTVIDHLDDCIAAYDFLKSQLPTKSNKIHVVGASYGGYLASVLSSRRTIESLVLRVPALYRDEDVGLPKLNLPRKPLELYRRTKLDPSGNIALNALSKFEGKVLLIESENDEVIPHEVLENYKNSIIKKNLTYTIMNGADHGLTGTYDKEFIRLLIEWFSTK
jgi:uncharacterized protein